MKSKKEEQKNTTSDDNELVACQQELATWKEKCLRVSADLDNFRRRMEKEQVRWMQVAQAQLLKDLLSIVDDFDRALSHKEKLEFTPEVAEWVSGVAMINTSFTKILSQSGLTKISETKTFDPELHEAVVQVDSPEHNAGEIVEVLQKGYRFNQQVLRPSKVSVAK